MADKIIDGYQYGYLGVVNEGIENYQGKVFDMPLLTIDKRPDKTYYVATLKNVEVLTQQESTKVFNQYKEHGWIDLMAADIEGLGAPSSSGINPRYIDPPSFVNLRFNASQLNNLPLELIEIQTNSQIDITINEPITVSVEELEEKAKKGFSFDDSGSTDISYKTISVF